jgi:integral membrane protein (TIGR00529 family)
MSPPLAVLATLVLILLVPRRVPMWATFLGACLLLPPLCGKGLGESARLWALAANDRTTWLFVASCGGVFVLSSILTHGGHLTALCDFASALVPSRRVRVGIMPALVGLVPMPGGAVVSAPLIDRSLGDSEVPGTDRNLINYWFRHIWEVSWPLYPSVLLALGWAGARGGDSGFLLAQGALTVVLAVAGYLALLSRVPKGHGAAAAAPPWPRLRALVPLVVLIAFPLVARANDTGSALLVVVVTVVLAIGAAIATTIDVAGLSKVPFDRRIYSMTALAYLIQVFGSLVKETGASEITARALGSAGLPAFLGVLALPFLAGFATGNTQTFVAMAFPIVIPGVLASGSPLLPWLVLAYAGGFLGYLTSPVHMCLVLSTRYFNSKLLAAYGRLAFPLFAFLCAAIVLFLALGGRFDR